MRQLLRRSRSARLVLLLLCGSARPTTADVKWDTAAQWSDWEFPAGVATITGDGWISVEGVRKRIDAVLDAPQFSYERVGNIQVGGIRAAGSNVGQAGNLLDGDPSTGWAPSADDDLDRWWVEVDLGRVVTATELKLLFAEDLPPFPQFKVFVSDGRKRFESSNLEDLAFEVIHATRKDFTASELSLNLEDRDRAGNLLMGRLVQYVRIVFTKKAVGPALTAVEVWSIGDNIALGTIQGGGFTISGQPAFPGRHVHDGLYWTAWETPLMGTPWAESAGRGVSQDWVGAFLKWDLGSQFWVDAIRILGRDLESRRSDMDGFRLYVSDGTTTTRPSKTVWQLGGEELSWDMVADLNNNDNDPRLLKFDVGFAPRRVRYLLLHHFYGFTSQNQQFVRGGAGGLIYEIQIFGEGKSPGVSLVSPIVELDPAEQVVRVTLGGRTPSGTSLRIRTRSGNEVVPIKRYFEPNGQEISKATYGRTPKFLQGPVVEEQSVGGDWSGWSQAHEGPKAEFLSPRPTRFVQVSVELASGDPATSPELDFVTLDTGPVLAERFEALIEPRRVIPARRDTFQLTLRQHLGSAGVGIDGLLIRGIWHPIFISASTAAGDLAAVGSFGEADSLRLQLARVVREDSVRVSLSGIVFRDGVSIAVVGMNSRSEGVRQGALESVGTKDALRVRLQGVAEGSGLLRDVALSASVLTPNADGIGDEVRLSFTVVRVTKPRRVTLAVYDLAGRLVRELLAEQGVAGRYEDIAWDGRDRDRNLVPPGNYVCRIKVEGDDGDDSALRILGVVY